MIATLRSRHVLAPTVVLFGIMTSHAILEAARDALFLAKLGPQRLAWAYLAIAGVALAAVTASRRWGKLRDARRMTIGFLVVAVIGTSIIAATITVAQSVVFVLYVWTGLVATLVVPSFWTMIDRSLRIADAKRVFATIGAGASSARCSAPVSRACWGVSSRPSTVHCESHDRARRSACVVPARRSARSRLSPACVTLPRWKR